MNKECDVPTPHISDTEPIILTVQDLVDTSSDAYVETKQRLRALLDGNKKFDAHMSEISLQLNGAPFKSHDPDDFFVAKAVLEVSDDDFDRAIVELEEQMLNKN